MRIAEALLTAALLAPSAVLASPETDVLGQWQTEDGGGVLRYEPCGSALCGVIIGTSGIGAHGGPLRDNEGRPQCHLAIVKGLHPGTDGRLHGTVTDPEDGRT